MAMNKAEKALVEGLRARAALTLPPYEEPQPMTLAEIEREQARTGNRYVEAWFMNAYAGWVTKGWTTGYIHDREAPLPPSDGRGRRSGSQTGGRAYATALDAHRAMRWEATREVMQKLARIDAMVEQAAEADKLAQAS
jgi:hypothetical protein